jgi:hypothetical protein
MFAIVYSFISSRLTSFSHDGYVDKKNTCTQNKRKPITEHRRKQAKTKVTKAKTIILRVLPQRWGLPIRGMIPHWKGNNNLTKTKRRTSEYERKENQTKNKTRPTTVL